MFKKKHDIFMSTLVKIADNLLEAVNLFHEQIGRLKEIDTEKFAEEIKIMEDKGDQYTHVIFTELNKTFITPLEREDIMHLTVKLDDILDGLENCADRLDLYNIREHDPYLSLFARLLKSCVTEVHRAIYLLSQKKLSEIRRHNFHINDLENEADQLFRESIKVLFSHNTDIVKIFKMKEIYEMLESVMDTCEDVANILEGVIMRNT